MRKPKIAVAAALKMYFDGCSLPKTGRNLMSILGVYLHWRNVHRWIEKYVPEVDALLRNFTPQLSGTWHSDETTLRFRPSEPLAAKEGGRKTRRPGQDWWQWDAIDEGTRFIVGTRVSRTRTYAEGKAFLKSCADLAPRPLAIVTDNLKVYPALVNKIFYSRDPSRRVQHFHSRGGFRDNQRIERWHGTLEDRITAMRGLKSPASQIPRGIAIDYNFLRPHLNLCGRTPARAAEIDLPFNDGWGDLMTWAAVYRTLCQMKTGMRPAMG